MAFSPSDGKTTLARGSGTFLLRLIYLRNLLDFQGNPTPHNSCISHQAAARRAGDGGERALQLLGTRKTKTICLWTSVQDPRGSGRGPTLGTWTPCGSSPHCRTRGCSQGPIQWTWTPCGCRTHPGPPGGAAPGPTLGMWTPYGSNPLSILPQLLKMSLHIPTYFPKTNSTTPTLFRATQGQIQVVIHCPPWGRFYIMQVCNSCASSAN